MAEVNAYHDWPSNAELIEDVASLGYIYGKVLDCTYGKGTFWKKWRPDGLVTSDINGEADIVADFTALPFADRSFDCVVFDPPYKLNGTPSEPDVRYGVHQPTGWRDRLRLIGAGAWECARVLGGGYLLVKCQDQVCSGQVRWQTDLVTAAVEAWCGLRKVDAFHMIGGRKQPEGRSQVHARRNGSTLLVFERV